MLHFHFILTFRFLSHSSDTHTHARIQTAASIGKRKPNSPRWAALFTAQRKSAQHQAQTKEIYRCSFCHPTPVSSVFVRCASSAKLGSWPCQCVVPPPIPVLIKSHLIENNSHTHTLRIASGGERQQLRICTHPSIFAASLRVCVSSVARFDGQAA